MYPLNVATCLFIMTCGAFAQTSTSRPEFEVADVKLNKSGAEPSGGVLPGGQFSVTNVPLMEVLQFAYHVDRSAFYGAPAWFSSDHFDVIGKGPPNTTAETLRLMLQSLLAKEFRLAVHEDLKPGDAFALVIAKGGPKLKKATGSVANVEDPSDQCKRTAGNGHIVADCRNITMADLARHLSGMARGYIDRPVVDLTGISGAWDAKLEWVGRQQIDTEGGLTIFDAVTKQLGLKLDPRKIPIPVIVIDHVERLSGS